MKEILFATGNEGKMKEIRQILAPLEVRVLSMKEARITAWIDENGETFEENALIKARALARQGRIVLADDSGLEIDYLGKEPGVHSSRFLGEDTSYLIKNKEILRLLEGVPKEERTARFVCVIAAVLPDGREYVVRGTMEGYIGLEAKGENGFGYDPIFVASAYDLPCAELTDAQKNECSHRGQALRKMMDLFLAENIVSKKN